MIFLKKILAFLLVALLLVSCAKSPSGEITLPGCFSADADITIGETVYTVCLNRFSEGRWQAEVMSPAAVKGLTFTIEGDTVTPGFKGLSFSFDRDKFPAGSVINIAIRAFDRLAAAPLGVIVGDENLLASGDIDGEAYALTVSKSGIPEHLEYGAMSVSFTRFDVAEEVEE